MAFANPEGCEIKQTTNPVPYFKYHCGKDFLVEEFNQIQSPKIRIGLVVLDNREVTIGFWDGADSVSEVWTDTSTVPGKHGRGGQSQMRFERNQKIASQAWYRKVAEEVSGIFKDTSVEYIILGGPAFLKHKLLEDGKLDYRVKPKIKYILDTENTNDAGLYELVAKYKRSHQ